MRRLALLGLPALMAAAGFCLLTASRPPAVQADSKAAAPRDVAEITPLLKKYCFDCHGAAKQNAGVALHKYTQTAAVQQDRKTWEAVAEMVRTHQMPPAKRPQPTAAEVERITTWIETTLAHVDCSGPTDPGRVTIRRLNRVEYNNTIRDLVGIDFHPADDFPSDDVGYGFDNIGDVLSLPPLLLEKYLSAAEQISEKAIVDSRHGVGPVTKFTAQEMQTRSRTGTYGAQGRNLFTTAELTQEHKFAKDGDYAVRIRAFGQQAGTEPARMSLRLDGKEVRLFDVTAEEAEPATYELHLAVTAGSRKLSVAFTNDFYNAKDPNPRNRDRNLIVEWVEVQGPLESPELPESHRRIITRRPTVEDADIRECAKAVLEPFVARAFRRPAAEDELQRLVDLVWHVMGDGDSYEKGIQIALQAVLTSPHFLFRIELDAEPDNPQAIHSINEFELASRLSYFLWSSLPDAELFTLARKGELRQRLDQQVRRMLRDPKSRALVENFAGQWLQIRNLQTVNPDPTRFPKFDDALRNDMRRETELFFEALLVEDRSILEFLSADFTYVNERLAKHYGLPNVRGDDFRRVPLKGTPRGGVLAQASILTITSNPTRTSPVKRGKWVLDNLLGTPPPPPPPGVPQLEEDEKVALTGSLRARLEQHRANPACASCHQRMDPLGFGLENFDAVGVWRTQDGQFHIDASGTLPSGQSFQGPGELRQILLERKGEFSRCLSEKLLTYALGRGLEAYDHCVVEQLSQDLAAHDYRFSTLILGIVHSDPFQKRRGKEEKP